MQLCDMHVHTTFSNDGLASMEEMCVDAVKKNLSAVAFTEHWDAQPGLPGEPHYLRTEAEREREYARLAKKYGDSPEILFGIELGQPHHNPESSERLLSTRSFDFVLGSIHFYKSADNHYHDIYELNYSEILPSVMFEDYFADMLRMVDYGGFDAIAHIDYPLRVLEGYIGAPTIKDYKDLIDPVLRKAAEKGIGIEIGTRGLYDWQKRVGPEDFVIRRFFELGGEIITTGSDAHQTKQLGRGLTDACRAARNAGFRRVACFKNRRPRFVDIDVL